MVTLSSTCTCIHMHVHGNAIKICSIKVHVHVCETMANRMDEMYHACVWPAWAEPTIHIPVHVYTCILYLHAHEGVSCAWVELTIHVYMCVWVSSVWRPLSKYVGGNRNVQYCTCTGRHVQCMYNMDTPLSQECSGRRWSEWSCQGPSHRPGWCWSSGTRRTVAN